MAAESRDVATEGLSQGFLALMQGRMGRCLVMDWP